MPACRSKIKIGHFILSVIYFVTSATSAAMAADEIVTIYPTYGYQAGDLWIIPMRLWVHERRSFTSSVAKTLVSKTEHPTPEQLRNFQARIDDFLADSESSESVVLEFENDPDHEDLRVADSTGRHPKSDRNGLLEGTLTIKRDRADVLRTVQGSTDGWLSLKVTSGGHSGTGRVRLIEPEGLSVISDIDDTIKVTEIPAGIEVVMRNTFYHDYMAAPEMAARFRKWPDASFHYVSGGPWQMYRPLSNSLIGKPDDVERFPEGSFHMKNIRKNLLSKSAWDDLKELVTNDEITVEQKVGQITQIIKNFPRRTFILVGDSGETDPEVYQTIRNTFPRQVQEICIRDIVNHRETNPKRLTGMTIIAAPTIHAGVSQRGSGIEKNRDPPRD